MKKVGIFVHSRWAAARRLADEVTSFLLNHVDTIWAATDWDDAATAKDIPGTDLLICLGGDGTMLRAARSVIPHPIPVLGVNMGRLGFLAELRPNELMERLPEVLDGRCRVEERTMLQVQVPSWGVTYHALNDIVVGRESVGRPMYVDVWVDGLRLAIYHCDAVIVASATGSTAYSLSAGGPILHPESRDMVLTPVAPHLATVRPLVLPPQTAIDLMASSDKEAIVSVDGQMDRPLGNGERVSVCRSPYVARFVRLSGPSQYYEMLAERLDWLRVLRASGHPELFDLNGISTPK
ncbi:MAG: NAD(+)/NADH kinase [Dehalococcoidia bacterium]|nr:NAD(+)/NADH kinase [Dehalococcoidia bacterium]